MKRDTWFKDVLLRASPSHPIQFKPSPLPPHHRSQYSPVNHDDGWKCPVLPWNTELVSVSASATKRLFVVKGVLGPFDCLAFLFTVVHKVSIFF